MLPHSIKIHYSQAVAITRAIAIATTLWSENKHQQEQYLINIVLKGVLSKCLLCIHFLPFYQEIAYMTFSWDISLILDGASSTSSSFSNRNQDSLAG